MLERRTAQILQYNFIQRIPLWFSPNTAASVLPFFFWKVLTCSQTFSTCGIQGWESRLDLCQISLSVFTVSPKIADLANPEHCEKREEFVYFNLNISVGIFSYCKYSVFASSISECDCQPVENPLLHVQLVLVFLLISPSGAADSDGSHTSGGSELWSGRVIPSGSLASALQFVWNK